MLAVSTRVKHQIVRNRIVGRNTLDRIVVVSVSSALMWALALSLSMTPIKAEKPVRIAYAQSTCENFKESGRSICGRFLDYWNNNGGLAQQGYPISSEMLEQSDTDGKTYVVQYFERAVFEKHPENKAPNDVLLQLVGVFAYNMRYPNGAPNQMANTSEGSQVFEATGKRTGGKFLEYWQAHGGLSQQGFPISDEFDEVSEIDGKTYRVQYFERAVMEYHPENEAPYDVLLGQLGTLVLKQRNEVGPSVPEASSRTKVVIP